MGNGKDIELFTGIAKDAVRSNSNTGMIRQYTTSKSMSGFAGKSMVTTGVILAAWSGIAALLPFIAAGVSPFVILGLLGLGFFLAE